MLQRASIGRALACDSKLLMLDEYSSGLDYFTKFELQDLLLKIFNNRDVDRTFLMVTHDSLSASYCDRVILMRDGVVSGELVRKGDRREFFNELMDVLRKLNGGE